MKTLTLNKINLEKVVAVASNYMIKSTDTVLDGMITIACIEDKMTISSTNYVETIAINNIPYTSSDITDANFKPFSVDGKKLLTVLKKTNADNVQLHLDADEITVQSGRSKVKLQTVEDTHSFLIANNMGIAINIDNIGMQLKRVFHAIDSNNPRYELNGALLKLSNGKLDVVSTDTKRLAVASQNIKGDDFEVIIPKNGVKSIINLFAGLGVKAHIQNDTIAITTENISYSVKSIAGAYPNYGRIIPQTFEQKISLNREKLIELAKEASMFVDAIEVNIKDGEIRLCDLDKATETREPTETGNTSIRFRINAKSLIDFCESYDDEKVQLAYNDKNVPLMLIAEPGYAEVMMPIIIGDEEDQEVAA